MERNCTRQRFNLPDDPDVTCDKNWGHARNTRSATRIYERGGRAKRLFPIKKAGWLPDPPTASPTRSGLENLVPFRRGDPWIVLGWLCRKWRRHSRGWKGWQSDRPRHEPVTLEKKNFFGRVPSCSSSSEGFARVFFYFLATPMKLLAVSSITSGNSRILILFHFLSLYESRLSLLFGGNFHRLLRWKWTCLEKMIELFKEYCFLGEYFG